MSARRAAPAAAVAATVTLICLQATGLGLAGERATATQAEPPRKTRVLVKDNYFEPRSVEVVDGRRVFWRWRGENRHNIRFTKIPKGTSRKGARTRVKGHWKRTFRRPGVYRYICRRWAGMRGTVTVLAKPEPQESKRRSARPSI
ncbi:MAG: cupredoxin domain-containing protein [Solirubrobacterales bacterium]